MQPASSNGGGSTSSTAAPPGATPVSSTPQAPVTGSPNPSVNTSAITRVLDLTNANRVANGVPPLSLNAQLVSSAQSFAQQMAQLNFFAHNSPDGTTPGQRITAAGYNWSTWGENIAMGYATPDEVMNGWMNSPGHRANILNPAFKDIGIGYDSNGNYWVQDFGAP